MPLHRTLRYSLLPGRFAVCRLEAGAAIPEWTLQANGFCSITRTSDELSIVCAEATVPATINAANGWMCLELEGPFAFSDTGVLSSFLAPLAESGVGIFAISTFGTDYVLIKEENWGKASATLREAGHELI